MTFRVNGAAAAARVDEKLVTQYFLRNNKADTR